MSARDILLGLLVAVLWGGNFVSAKFGVAHFPPLLLTALRFTVVAALLMPFAWHRRARLPAILQLSFVLGVLHFSLLFAGMWKGLDIATTAIAAQLGVPFSCLFGAILWNDRLGRWRTLGMVISFMGIIVVAGTPHVAGHFTGFLLALTGALCWGAANILMKRMGQVEMVPLLGWMALFAVPQLLLLSLLFERDHMALLAAAPASALLSVLYTALFSTIAAYGIWYWLLARLPVTQVVPFNLLSPVFGIAFGQVFFAEELTLRTVAGGVITILGVAIIVLRRPRLAQMGEAI